MSNEKTSASTDLAVSTRFVDAVMKEFAGAVGKIELSVR